MTSIRANEIAYVRPVCWQFRPAGLPVGYDLFQVPLPRGVVALLESGDDENPGTVVVHDALFGGGTTLPILPSAEE